MKQFNPELNKDITELKTLSIKRDKTDFLKRIVELTAKYNVCKATIYRELKKEVPGSYTRPNHSGDRRAISEKEIDMVKELLLKKVPIMDIGRIMESETGEKYSWERIDKLRQIVDMRINESGEPLDKAFVTSFGYPIKSLVEQALKLDKIAPNAYVEFNAGEKTYKLNYHEARDIALICANAVVRSNMGFDDEITYLKAKLRILFREKIRTAPVQTTVKEYLNLKHQLDNYAREYEHERQWMKKSSD